MEQILDLTATEMCTVKRLLKSGVVQIHAMYAGYKVLPKVTASNSLKQYDNLFSHASLRTKSLNKVIISFIFWRHWRHCKVGGAPRESGNFFGCCAKRVIVTTCCRRFATASRAVENWTSDCGVSSCDTVKSGSFPCYVCSAEAMVRPSKLNSIKGLVCVMKIRCVYCQLRTVFV